jgi:hypothetical protein
MKNAKSTAMKDQDQKLKIYQNSSKRPSLQSILFPKHVHATVALLLKKTARSDRLSGPGGAYSFCFT